MKSFLFRSLTLSFSLCGLLLACSDYDVEREFQQIRKFLERGVDGLILVGENHHPDLEKFLLRRDVPMINTFVYSQQSHGTCIGPDNHKLFYDMTRHLIDLGHEIFAVVAQSVENNDRAQARLQGIKDALAEKGIAVRPQHFAIGQWSISEGRNLFARVMGQSPRPTAVICGNPSLAVGAYLESVAMGLRVPADVSIVGYDDIEVMSHLPVPLTTVRVQSEQVGRNAARFLLGRLEGRDIEMEISAYENTHPNVGVWLKLTAKKPFDRRTMEAKDDERKRLPF